MTSPAALQSKEPTEFWQGKPTNFDIGTLREEANRLPDTREMSPLFLVQTVYVFGLHAKHCEKSEVLEIWKPIEEAWFASAIKKANAFTPKDIANLLYGLAKIGVELPNPFLDTLFVVAERKLESFLPDDLATMILSAGKLDLTPPESFMERFFPVLLLEIADFESKELYKTAYGLATLGVPLDKIPNAFWIAFFPAVTEKIWGFDHQSLSNLVYALSRLGVPPSQIPDMFWQAYFDAVVLALPEFNPQDLSNLPPAWSRMKLRAAVIPSSFWGPYFTEIKKKLDGFNRQDLSNTFFGLTCLNIEFPDDEPDKLMSSFLETIEKQFPGFSPQEMANTIYALARLEISPRKEFWDSYFNVCVPKLSEFNTQDLSTTLYALARLGISPTDEFWKAYFQAAASKLPDFNAQDLSNTFWALAVLSVLKNLPEGSLDFAFALLQYVKAVDLSFFGKNACHHACLRFFCDEADSFFIHTLEKEVSSHLEITFGERLVKAGFFPDELLRNISSLGTKTDYAFLIDGKLVLMEVDGPYHFTIEFPEKRSFYNGPTRFMTALITQTNPEAVLIRVGWEEADFLLDPKNAHFFEELRDKVLRLEHGAYRIIFDENNELSFVPIVSEEVYQSAKIAWHTIKNRSDARPAP